MKAAVYEGIERITVREYGNPKCDPNSIVIRVNSCAICGSDIRIYHHGKSNLKPPQITGHEIAGTVTETGKNVTSYSVGDRIQVPAIVSCGECYYCKKGRSNLCEHFAAIGYEYQGGFAEYMPVPSQMIRDNSVNRIDNKVSFDEACIAEPIACAINGQELSQVSDGDIVVIIGAGPIGCMHIELAKINGAKKIILSDISKERLKIAEQFSADYYINPSEEDIISRVMNITNNHGADVIIVAASSGKAQEDAVKMAAYYGRINFFGGLPKDNSYVKLDSNLIHYKELFINGTSGSLPRHNKKALDLITSGKLDANKFITHRFPLDKILEGFTVIEKGLALKVVINP